MTTGKLRWRAALAIHLLDDDVRQSTLAGIEKVAPQGSLIQVPSIAASYGALQAKGKAFADSVATAAAHEALYKASLGAANDARLAVDLELRTYKTLVENNAAVGADLTSMGLAISNAAHASRTPPDPPPSLLVKTGTARGKARVVVDAKGYQGRFVAELSPDGTTWSPLPGTGKQRRLSGYPSGTQLWVRFAAVRFGMQSDWCTPVLVIIP